MSFLEALNNNPDFLNDFLKKSRSSILKKVKQNTNGGVRIFDTKRKKRRIKKSINMKRIQSYYLKEFVSHH